MVLGSAAGADVGLTLRDFANTHAGETIYVLGSGASLDYIAPGFFDDKTVVTTNLVGIRLSLPSFYTVTHYHRDAEIVADARPDLTVITPVLDLGRFGPEAAFRVPPQENVCFAPTNDQQFDGFSAARDWPTEPDTLVAGPTSLHMTMHFAQYLGAAHIILVGADCGTLGHKSNFEGYAVGDNPFAIWQRHIGEVAEQIRARGTSVHSLNPFVNFALEGTPFRGPTVQIN